MEDLDRIFKNKHLNSIFSALKSEGAEARFIGGCVRDAMLKRDISDIDIATDLAPDLVEIALSKAKIKHIPIGKSHGTIAAIADGIMYEITTLRKDISTDGRHAVVSYTKDWKIDAYRRDFTINAMSYCPYQKRLYDYSTGVEDIKSSLVRFIGEPEERVKEDYLRILRYFRFISMFPNQVWDEASFNACVKYSDNLSGISGERKWVELSKILQLGNLEVISLMVDSGVLEKLIGKIRVGYDDMLTRLDSDLLLLRLLILIPDETKIVEVAKELKLSNILQRQLNDLRKISFLIVTTDMFYLVSKHGKATVADALKLRNAIEPVFDENKTQELDKISVPDFPVNGADIMREFNLPPCKDVGDRLSLARDIWYGERGMINKEQLLKKIK